MAGYYTRHPIMRDQPLRMDEPPDGPVDGWTDGQTLVVVEGGEIQFQVRTVRPNRACDMIRVHVRVFA